MKFSFEFFIRSQETMHQAAITKDGQGQAVADTADEAAKGIQYRLMRDFNVARYEIAIQFK